MEALIQRVIEQQKLILEIDAHYREKTLVLEQEIADLEAQVNERHQGERQPQTPLRSSKGTKSKR